MMIPFSKAVRSFETGVEYCVDRIGKGVSWLSLLLVTVVLFDVITRYVLQKSTVAAQELQWHLFAALFLLATAYTLKENGHVRVDMFYARFSTRGKALCDLLGTLLLLLPFCTIVLWTSVPYVLNSWSIQESSPDPGGLPARYLLKACIPLGYGLVIVQAIHAVIRSSRLLIRNSGEAP